MDMASFMQLTAAASMTNGIAGAPGGGGGGGGPPPSTDFNFTMDTSTYTPPTGSAVDFTI